MTDAMRAPVAAAIRDPRKSDLLDSSIASEDTKFATATQALSASNSLADLAARIKAEHEATAASLKSGVKHAMAAGDLLVEARAQLKHGQWLPWLDTCGISERMAQRYMRLARNRAVIEAKSDTVSDLGIKGALSLLTVQRDGPNDCVTALADSAAELAFDWQELDDIDREEAERKKRLQLHAEAGAAVNRIGKLAEQNPALAEIIDDGVEAEQLVAACEAYSAAVAAEMGLSLEVHHKINAAVADGDGADAWSIYKKFQHELEEVNPRPAVPSPTVILASVRNIANAWLARIEAAADAIAEQEGR